MKYPKVLVQELAKLYPKLPRIGGVALIVDRFDRMALTESSRPIQVRAVFTVDDNEAVRDEVLLALKQLADRPPTSKFGVVGAIDVVLPGQLVDAVRRKRLHLYPNGVTWKSAGQCDVTRLQQLIGDAGTRPRTGRYDYPLIVSNVAVHEDPGDF